MTTISEIAKRTGVSIATVSRVLNGYSDVNQATREKIQRVIVELGYSPGALSRAQNKGKSMAIGAFYFAGEGGELTHPFFQDVLDSFKRTIGVLGYDVLFFAVNSPTSDTESFEARAKFRNVDGILLASVSKYDPRARSLAISQLPCMSIDTDLIGARAGYISSDNLGGAGQAVHYLVSLGHTKIAFMGDEFNTKPGHDRLVGYQQSLNRHQLTFRPDWVMNGDFSVEGGYRATQKLLRSEDRPTAIFCAGDLMAFGAMSAVREIGLEVGSDVSIVGFDDVSASSLVTPALTTVRQHRREMGLRAAESLVQLITEPESVPPIVTVPTELIIRESARPPRGSA